MDLLERHLGLSAVPNAHSFAEAAQLLSAYPAISIAVFDILLAGWVDWRALRACASPIRICALPSSVRRRDARIFLGHSLFVYTVIYRSITQTEAIAALQTIAEGHICVPTELFGRTRGTTTSRSLSRRCRPSALTADNMKSWSFGPGQDQQTDRPGTMAGGKHRQGACQRDIQSAERA